MTPLPALLRHEVRLQYRYGIYAAYGVVVVFYALILLTGRPFVPDWLVAFIVFSDPSALGFFFLGGLMLLEKGQGVRAALAVAPVSARDYLIAKAVPLTALAVVGVIVLGLAKAGPVNWLVLVPVVALTSVFYIGIGAAVALQFRTVNAYLIGSAALLTPIILPALIALVEPFPLLAALIPSTAQFRLMLVALGGAPASGLEIAVMILVLCAAALFSWIAGERALGTELGRK